jgi:Flp pilus assembly pilin Flp
MCKLLKQLWADEGAATSIEYGMIALIMGVGIVATISSFPTLLNQIWSNVASFIN